MIMGHSLDWPVYALSWRMIQHDRFYYDMTSLSVHPEIHLASQGSGIQKANIQHIYKATTYKTHPDTSSTYSLDSNVTWQHSYFWLSNRTDWILFIKMYCCVVLLYCNTKGHWISDLNNRKTISKRFKLWNKIALSKVLTVSHEQRAQKNVANWQHRGRHSPPPFLHPTQCY